MREEFINCMRANDIPFKLNDGKRLNRSDSVTVYSRTKVAGKFGRPYLRISGFGRRDGRYRVTSSGYSNYLTLKETLYVIEKLNK